MSIAPPPAPPAAPVTPPPSGESPPTNAAPAAPSWRDTLPDDLKADKSLESFKDVSGLAKSYVETKKLVGAKTEGLIKVPGKDAKPEEVAAYRTALGVPESPDKYEITRPEVAVDSMVWDEAGEKDYLAAMHASGAPPAVVQAGLDFYGKWFGGQMEKARQEAQATLAALRDEWGANFDANLGRANRAMREFGGPEFDEFMAKSGLGRHPLAVKAFANIGNALVEHGALPPTGTPRVSREEAQAELNAMLTDPKHAFHNPTLPGFDAAVQRRRELMRIIDGPEGAKIVARVG